MRSFIFIFCFVFLCQAFAAQTSEQIPGEYLVKYREHAQLAAFKLRATVGVRLLAEIPSAKLLQIHIAPKHEAKALQSLSDGLDSNIEYIAPNLVVSMLTAPFEATGATDATDATAAKNQEAQWALAKIRAEDAWQAAGHRGSRSVVIAVIDTGADYRHESLAPNMVPGRDFINNSNDPMDNRTSGHGTHCSGVIGATGLIDGGTIGISPQVSIMPLRFLDENGRGSTANAIRAIDYAIEHRVQIISASWGSRATPSEAKPMIEAVKRASDAGVIFVMSAGNHGENTDHYDTYPANAKFANTITVGASSEDESRPDWSNYGRSKVDLVAPGKAILSTLPENRYGKKSGTSMAAPLVSGLTAFLMAQQPSLSGEMIRSLLQVTGAYSPVLSACDCRIDALNATKALLNEKMFIVPAARTMEVGESIHFKVVFGQAPFVFRVMNTDVGTIDQFGKFTATASGLTTVKVIDATGTETSTLAIRVVEN